MELNADKQLIRKVLSNKNTYNIPRYQREYSWENPEITEFLGDILKQLKFENGEVKSDDYFIGSILLTGDYNSSGKKLDVVDGQQRLTTITILLSALAEAFAKNKNMELYNIVWEYIVGKDDNGKEYPILYNEVQYPYFQYYIQRKERKDVEPTCEEEDRIKKAFEYFSNCLREENLRKIISRIHPSADIVSYEYSELLKGVRNQILECYVICIWTTETKYANEIFEILNAKGKQLSPVDLIKNNIFKVLEEEIPDDPQIIWKEIKKILNYDNGRIDFSEFYRHYWLSKYKKVTYEKLYDEFIKTIPENKDRYRAFIEDLSAESKTYMKIVNPKREDYSKRKEYFYLVESLNNVNNIFGIKQTRIAYMALFNAKEKGIISNKQFKTTILYIEDFHFVYNSVCTLRANSFESIYSQFAIALNRAKDSNEGQKAIEMLHKRLQELYPTYEIFEQKFIKIRYSKKYLNTNMVAKYIVNRVDKYYGNREIVRDDGSIEHIMSESTDEISQNIGNLILLEVGINRECENAEFIEKKEKYSTSAYNGVKEFLQVYESVSIWDPDRIFARAKKLAKLMYYNNLNCTSKYDL